MRLDAVLVYYAEGAILGMWGVLVPRNNCPVSNGAGIKARTAHRENVWKDWSQVCSEVPRSMFKRGITLRPICCEGFRRIFEARIIAISAKPMLNSFDSVSGMWRGKCLLKLGEF